MKNILFISLLFIAAFTKAQDSSYCYNSRKTSVGFSAETEATTSIKQQNSLILMPVMNEKEVLMILKEKDNSEINKLIKNFKLSKTFKNIGFSAIPEALLGAGLIGTASASNTGGVHQKSIGIGLVALSAVCLSSGLYFKIVQSKNYKKAIKRYNELNN